MKKINKSGYPERNHLVWKMHKIRDNLCWWCACPRACVSVGNQQKGACELNSFALFVVSDQPLGWRSLPWQCGSVYRSHQDRLPSLYIRFPHPQDGINSACTHIHRSAVLCSLQGVDIPDLPQTNKSPCAWK